MYIHIYNNRKNEPSKVIPFTPAATTTTRVCVCVYNISSEALINKARRTVRGCMHVLFFPTPPLFVYLYISSMNGMQLDIDVAVAAAAARAASLGIYINARGC